MTERGGRRVRLQGERREARKRGRDKERREKIVANLITATNCNSFKIINYIL